MLDKGEKNNIYVHKHTPITSPLLSSTLSSPTPFPSSFSPRFRSPFPSYHPPDVQSSFLLSSSPLFPPMLPSLLSPSSASFPPSPSSSVASFSFSPPSPLGPYHSPPSLLLLSPSSLEILQLCPLTVFHPLLPPFLLSSNLCTLFPTSLPLSSQSILISRSCSLSPSFSPIHCLFPPSLVWSFSLPPLSFDTSPTRKIYLFHFSLSRPQLSPLTHCLHLPKTLLPPTHHLHYFSYSFLSHKHSKFHQTINFSQNSLPNFVSRQKRYPR